ncbi:CheR family methyltransferase [Vogesella sp. LIG4]|uniref:CheR family methyltransferase n=1 Tax=Vogesella sp. LIG4 TaxID=1192162 RepID=UPI0008200A57|nr:CheR family methyltransferase [Vogesella sp. LIG4]SCK05557.1 chemotaxis protein methyltransferase CheR [Vogesella sp. LIG4]
MGGVLKPASDDGAIFPRDLHFSEADFHAVRSLLYDRTGIALSDAKNHMAYARLAKRVRHQGFRSFADYLALLHSPQGEREWEHFINALTTNLTAFFREGHHFDILRQHARQHAGDEGGYRVWSSAASTGEEPYSILFTLAQSLAGGSYDIVASDIDTNVLAKAAAGVYGADRVASLAPELLRQFFVRGVGGNAGKVKVKASYAQQIRFCRINLVDDSWPQLGLFDVIFCRNVLIYFDKPTQAGIIEHFARYLKPHGLLFLGHSENIQHISQTFVPCGKTAYRLAGG